MLSARTIASLITRIQNAFLNCPPVTMTLDQVQREFSIDRATCQALLDVLVEATVLARTPEGAFVRFLPHRTAAISHAA